MKTNFLQSFVSSISFFTIVRCLLIMAGIVLLAQTLFFLPVTIREHYSTEWPTATGVIQAAGLRPYHEQSNRPATFTPNIVYSYEVNGVPRSSTQVNFANGSRRFLEKEGVAWLEQNYPTGKAVTVHYDPSNPDTAVLMPGAPGLLIRGWCLPFMAACFVFSAFLSPRLGERHSARNLTGDAGSNGPASPLPLLVFGEPTGKAA